VLSVHDERVYAERALRAGALAYVMKHAPVEQVITAVRKALAGEHHFSPKMQKCLGNAADMLRADHVSHYGSLSR
jgi:DNA-binding NarL/FixJ family response regulator